MEDPNYEPVVQNCTIRDNHALDTSGGGGGIYCSAHADVNINNSSILANTALRRGGGIFWADEAAVRGTDFGAIAMENARG